MENHKMGNELDELQMKLKVKEAECQQQRARLDELEQLSVKHKYKGESWEEQEEEWRKREEASSLKSARDSESDGAKDLLKKTGLSFWMNAANSSH
eukprot:scaffold553952_cov46-Prasinocladus_malaysianus.AAC.1